MLPATYQDYSRAPKSIDVPECIDVPSGSYAVVHTQGKYTKRPRMMSSGGYMECVGVLMKATDATGATTGYALAHLTVDNDPQASVHAMADALRQGNNAIHLDIDIFGGYKDFDIKAPTTPDQLSAQSLQTAQTLPNSTVANYLDNEALRIHVAVDLKTGQKYGGAERTITQGELISTMIFQPSIKPNGALAKRKHSSHTVTTATAAHNLDWQAEQPEITEIWNNHRSAVVALARKNNDGLKLWSARA